MIIGVINSSFKNIQVIPAAAHLLQIFRRLALRQSIWNCWNKQALDLIALFSKNCNAIRQEFETYHRKPPLHPNEPNYAGAALWSRALRLTIEKNWKIINEATLSSNIPDNTWDDAKELYEQLRVALYAYQKQKYSDWLFTLEEVDSSFFHERLSMVSRYTYLYLVK